MHSFTENKRGSNGLHGQKELLEKLISFAQDYVFKSYCT
jgi:hypothetical protein